jgi:hypothetical protein
VKRSWNQLSLPGRIALVVALGTAAITLVSAARRDLHTRNPGLIRGNPDVWEKVTYMPGGAGAYLTIGRRRHA